MYTSFYGLREKPFTLTPDPKYLFLSSVHKRGLAYLEYGLREKRDVIVVSGEVGSGKTTLIRVILKSLDPNIRVAWIINPLLSPNELLKMILHDLGLDAKGADKADMLSAFNDYLVEETLAGNRVLLIIDEAQNLSSEALEEIRLLSNLETSKEKLLQILLVGQPELRDTLRSYELRQLNQRIGLFFHLNPLSQEETYDYIMHRLQVGGLNDGRRLFTDGALKRIGHVSGGIPRVINLVCDASLLAGFVDGVQVIEEDLVDESMAEIQLDYPARGKPDDRTVKESQEDTADIFDHFQRIFREVSDLCERFPMETHLLSLFLREGSSRPMNERLLKNFREMYYLERELTQRRQDAEKEERDSSSLD